MSDNQATFLKRVISALLGAAVVFAIGYFGGQPGLRLVCIVAVLLSTREYSRMIFAHSQMPEATGWIYRIICILLYVAMFYQFSSSSLELAIAAVVFLSISLWLAREKVSNENLLNALALGCFGLIYCVLFPFFALKLVMMPDGGHWFFFLLLVVFFGDTFAYFGGRWFGKTKLMPQVSPNKTWAGAVTGLVGSSFAGTLYLASAFQEIAWYKTFLFCIVCGMAAQSGDLLMSLVKRVAHVKDSGTLMPGHGGILDRLDGIFIACPLIYAFALYVRPF